VNKQRSLHSSIVGHCFRSKCWRTEGGGRIRFFEGREGKPGVGRSVFYPKKSAAQEE